MVNLRYVSEMTTEKASSLCMVGWLDVKAVWDLECTLNTLPGCDNDCVCKASTSFAQVCEYLIGSAHEEEEIP